MQLDQAACCNYYNALMSNRPLHNSGSQAEPTAKRKLKRWIASIFLLPLLLLTVLALAIAYRIHAENSEAGHDHLPQFQRPQRVSSILIFSPHPDDETLGAAGLIQETVRAGGTAHVVFMTNGDAFRVGVATYYKILQVHPSDYIRYGEMRQKEALNALSTLGLPAGDVTFLGYADRGLMPMWKSNWLPTQPWQSTYSKAKTNPYPNAPSFGKPYCGENVLADIEAQILADHPTDIYTTHPTDDHPDHSASSSFVLAAIKDLEAKGTPWASAIHLHFFIIHRGDWPIPQGEYTDLPLGPPAAFAGLDTDWHSLALTAPEIKTKHTALDHYISQEEMMDRLLVSFVRTNEIFGELPESSEQAEVVPNTSAILTADAGQWPGSAPVAKDPVADSELRVFQPGGDIKAIYAAYDSRNLYIRVAMHSRLSRTISYELALRPFDTKMATVPQALTFAFSPGSVPEGTWKQLSSGVSVNWDGAVCEYVIPMSNLGVNHVKMIFAQATTTFSQVTIDHTGYRPIFLSRSPNSTPLS